MAQLIAYCKYFSRVLKAGFGRDKAVSATVFQEERNDVRLPYRLVAFELGGAPSQEVKVTRINLPELLAELEHLGRRHLSGGGHGDIYRDRIARVYETKKGTPTVFVIKPDMCRYWTRSAGLHDADEVALDIFRWHQAATRSKVTS
jgi:hypothetical protein